jgi:acetyl-CoA synthetase
VTGNGSKADTINVAGKRVGPAEVESALVPNTAVAEAAAIGVLDELKGEVLVFFACFPKRRLPVMRCVRN